MEFDKLLTKKEASAVLRIDLRTLDKLLADRAIPSFKVGASVRIAAADLRNYLETSKRSM